MMMMNKPRKRARIRTKNSKPRFEKRLVDLIRDGVKPKYNERGNSKDIHSLEIATSS